MGDDEWSDVEAQKTHLMEVPECLVEERRDDEQYSNAAPPLESQATMALETISVEDVRRSRRRNIDTYDRSHNNDSAGNSGDVDLSQASDEATCMLDVSKLREQSGEQPTFDKPRSAPAQKATAAISERLLDAGRAKPFPFERLRRLAAEEVGALESLYSVLPPGRGMESTIEAVARRLEEAVGCAHRVQWSGVGMAIASGNAVELGDGVWSWGRMPPKHHRFLVGAQRSLADAWASTIGAKYPGVLGPDFRFGIVTYILAEFCDAFAAEAGWPAWVWAVNPMGERDLKTMLLSGESILLEVVFTVECEGRRGVVRWWVPDGLLRQLEAWGQDRVDWKHAASTSWWGGLRIERPVVMGTTTVRPGEWERIRIGDVLLLERHGVDVGEAGASSVEGGAWWRYAKAKAVRGRLKAGASGNWRFEVDSQQLVTNRQEMEMSEEKSEVEATGGASLEIAQMEVEVRLGTIEMELAELARLRPGQVLDCETPLGSSVELVVSGAPVGNGELVGVDGKLGVRILSMARRGSGTLVGG